MLVYRADQPRWQYNESSKADYAVSTFTLFTNVKDQAEEG